MDVSEITALNPDLELSSKTTQKKNRGTKMIIDHTYQIPANPVRTSMMAINDLVTEYRARKKEANEPQQQDWSEEVANIKESTHW